jgi:hypothetical protein
LSSIRGRSSRVVTESTISIIGSTTRWVKKVTLPTKQPDTTRERDGLMMYFACKCVGL